MASSCFPGFLMQMPILQPHKKLDRWILVEDWEIFDFTIPKGFITDLDTIPRIPYIYAFFKGYARSSALLHDWFYTNGIVSRKQADKMFLKVMRMEGIGRIRSRMMYWAVRVFGKKFYPK